MNLNQSIRDAFIASVMNDVPSIDYDSQFKKIVELDMIKQAPTKALRECLKDPASRAYCLHPYSRFSHSCKNPDGGSIHSNSVGLNNIATYDDYEISEEAEKDIDSIVIAAYAQTKQREALGTQVRSAIYACRTLKQALERLPEFAKYLPEPTATTVNLPAIANLAADLIRAGWPKGATA